MLLLLWLLLHVVLPLLRFPVLLVHLPFLSFFSVLGGGVAGCSDSCVLSGVAGQDFCPGDVFDCLSCLLLSICVV